MPPAITGRFVDERPHTFIGKILDIEKGIIDLKTPESYTRRANLINIRSDASPYWRYKKPNHQSSSKCNVGRQRPCRPMLHPLPRSKAR